MNPFVIKSKSDSMYQNLVAVAAVLQATSNHGARYVVEDVYFDYGQDWMWTTICRKGYNDCQVLNPREWEEIILANNAEDLFRAVKMIQTGKWFSD